MIKSDKYEEALLEAVTEYIQNMPEEQYNANGDRFYV